MCFSKVRIERERLHQCFCGELARTKMPRQPHVGRSIAGVFSDRLLEVSDGFLNTGRVTPLLKEPSLEARFLDFRLDGAQSGELRLLLRRDSPGIHFNEQA